MATALPTAQHQGKPPGAYFLAALWASSQADRTERVNLGQPRWDRGMHMSRRQDNFDRDVAAARQELIEQLTRLSKSFQR
jgi:hypothetical protein